MPLTGYLTASAIEAGVVHLANTFPALCELIVVPEPSIEGRRIRAVRIGDRSRPSRPGILVIAGAHAREVMNPDMLLMLGLKLCKAVTDRTGLTFGSKTYDAATLKALTEQADLYFLPLVNPDGRAFVQSPTGNPMWRKIATPILACRGKVWTSIATTIFCGPAASAPRATRRPTSTRATGRFPSLRPEMCALFWMNIPTSACFSTFIPIPSSFSIPGAMTITKPAIRP